MGATEDASPSRACCELLGTAPPLLCRTCSPGFRPLAPSSSAASIATSWSRLLLPIMSDARLAGRLHKELKMLQDPPPGVCVWPAHDSTLSRLHARTTFLCPPPMSSFLSFPLPRCPLSSRSWPFWCLVTQQCLWLLLYR